MRFAKSQESSLSNISQETAKTPNTPLTPLTPKTPSTPFAPPTPIASGVNNNNNGSTTTTTHPILKVTNASASSSSSSHVIAQAEVAAQQQQAQQPEPETVLDPSAVIIKMAPNPEQPVPVVQQQQIPQLSSSTAVIVTNQKNSHTPGVVTNNKMSNSNHNIARTGNGNHVVSTITGSRVSFSDLTSVSGGGFHVGADVGRSFVTPAQKLGLSSSGSGYFGTSSTWDGPMSSATVIKNEAINHYDDEDDDYLDDEEEWSS